jgi:hypothetical protein
MPKTCDTHMSVTERETLSLGLARSHSCRTMVTLVGRASGTAAAGPRGADRMVSVRRTPGGGRANSWTPGCGGTSGHTWPGASFRRRSMSAVGRESVTRCFGEGGDGCIGWCILLARIIHDDSLRNR